MSDEPDPAGGCTEVLVTVPREVASRLEGFLQANGIACRVRRNQDSTPEQVTEELLRRSQPGAAAALDTPFVGRMMRSRMRKDLRSGREGALPAMFDVLVRPRDLASSSTSPTVPQATDARVEGQPPSGGVGAGDGAPAAVLCERSWDRAWEIVSRLDEAGIQAAILPNEDEPVAPTIEGGMFRVGVRAEDLERAKQLIEG